MPSRAQRQANLAFKQMCPTGRTYRPRLRAIEAQEVLVVKQHGANLNLLMTTTTTPGDPTRGTQGAPPLGNPTPWCLFPADAKCGHPEDEIFSVLCTASIKSVEFEEALDWLFTQSVTAAEPTSSTPSPADSTSGDLGAQVATAPAGTQSFSVAQVPFHHAMYPATRCQHIPRPTTPSTRSGCRGS
jgi:hypothetical protein